jgi:uncharacterized membrane protein
MTFFEIERKIASTLTDPISLRQGGRRFMAWIKLVHVLAVFIWVGNLLALTRLMSYHVKQTPETQAQLVKIYQRMVYFIGIPAMILAILCGMILITNVNWNYRPGWFHMKLLFVTGIVIADLTVMRQVGRLTQGPDLSRGVRYKVVHGIVGLMLIGILCSAYLVRDRRGEIALQVREEMLQHEYIALENK